MLDGGTRGTCPDRPDATIPSGPSGRVERTRETQRRRRSTPKRLRVCVRACAVYGAVDRRLK